MSDVDWTNLLPAFSEAPRENGTEGLAKAAASITAQLDRLGVRWELYWWFLRRSRLYAATVTALLLAAVPIAQLDWQVPLAHGSGAR